MVKNLPAIRETWVWSLGWEDPLKEGMSIHPSILAWRIPWREEPGGLQIHGRQGQKKSSVFVCMWLSLSGSLTVTFWTKGTDTSQKVLDPRLDGTWCMTASTWRERCVCGAWTYFVWDEEEQPHPHFKGPQCLSVLGVPLPGNHTWFGVEGSGVSPGSTRCSCLLLEIHLCTSESHFPPLQS